MKKPSEEGKEVMRVLLTLSAKQTEVVKEKMEKTGLSSQELIRKIIDKALGLEVEVF